MSALDNLLAESLTGMIRKKLGKKTFQKIEKRLRDRYDISIEEAVRDFQKMDATLREFFGSGADEMEKDFLGDFVSVDSSKGDQSWITIEDPNLSRLILESFGDTDKKMILDSSMMQPNVILDILNNCNIPKSSGYRLTKELLRAGLLTEKGFSTTSDGKRVSKYTSLFKNVKIDINENKVTARVQLNEGFLKESYLLKVAQGM